jgi:PcfJ-like protein
MSKKDKKIKEQQLLAIKQKEEVINNALKFSKKRFKRFDDVINLLYQGEDLSLFNADRRIARVRECFAKVPVETKPAGRAILKNVFVHLSKCSLLFADEDSIQALFNMIQFRHDWRNDVFDWQPVAKRGALQVNELAFFLFCRYEVPEFLYKSFYEKTNTLFIQWFIHLGSGKKVRELMKVPIAFTQRTAHYFLQAPARFAIPEALRWAQVKGMMPVRAGTDGDADKLAERFAYSWLGNNGYDQDELWEAFIRIVLNGGMFDHNRLTELIDYVQHAKRENANYTLKGRTLHSLMRQSDQWHETAMFIKGNQFWNSSGMHGYKLERKEDVIKMEELTSSKSLADEGITMKHCVASYAPFCMNGKVAIYSLRRYVMGTLADRLATVEVNLSLKRVVQAKSKLNRKISDEAKKYLHEWAGKNGLSVGPYL